MTIPQDHRGFQIQQRFVELLNVGSVTIEAFGAAEVVDVTYPEQGTAQTPGGGRTVWNVRVPTVDDPCNWIVNSVCPIPSGAYGKPGTKDSPMLALVESGVSQGDRVGIKAGTCALSKNHCGFVVDQTPANNLAQVTRIDDCNRSGAMLRAYDCIKPGSTSGTAKVQRRGTTGWENDPAYSSPVCVDNSDCLVFALPGELFQAQRLSSCADNGSVGSSGSVCWLPTAEHGLQRRVRIDTCIPCGQSGDAQVLQSVCGGGSGGSGCDKQDADCSTITVCNTSGRPISPCGPEEATAWLTPGVKVTGTDCCWNLTAGPYPTRLKGYLGPKLCGGAIEYPTGVKYLNVCDSDAWPKPTTIGNPMALEACSGALFYADLVLTDCTCSWELTMVSPKKITQLTKKPKFTCGVSTCSLDAEVYKNVLVWSCDDTVCTDSPATETVQSGTLLTMTDTDLDASCSGSSGLPRVTRTSVKFCAFCVGETADGGSHDIGVALTLSQGVSASSCLNQTQVGAVVLCAGTPTTGAIPGVTCREDCPGSGA